MAVISRNILMLALVSVLLFVASCSENGLAGPQIDENLISREVSHLFVRDGSVARLAEIVTVHNRVNVVFQTDITLFNSVEMPLELSAVKNRNFIYVAASYESGNDSLFKINVGANIPFVELRTQLPFSNHNSVRFFENIGGFVVFADTAIGFDADSLKLSQGVSFGHSGAALTHAKGDTMLVVSNERLEGFSAITRERNVSITLPVLTNGEWLAIADSGAVVYLLGSENGIGTRLFRVDISTGEVIDTEADGVFGIDSDVMGTLFVVRATDDGNTLFSIGLDGAYEELLGLPMGLKATRANVYSYTDSDVLNLSVFRTDNLNRSTAVTLLNEVITFVSEK